MSTIQKSLLLIVLVITHCLAVINANKSSSSEIRCQNGEMYRENDCNYCSCRDGSLLICTYLNCSGEHYFKLKYCNVGEVWKTECNQCMCTEEYGTLCTVKECAEENLDVPDADDV